MSNVDFSVFSDSATVLRVLKASCACVASMIEALHHKVVMQHATERIKLLGRCVVFLITGVLVLLTFV